MPPAGRRPLHLAEHVPLRGPYQSPGPRPWARRVRRRVPVSLYQRHWHAPQLALHQLGCAGQLVGYGDDGCPHELAGGVLHPPVVLHRTHTRYPYGHIHSTLPPGAPEGVGDDDCHVHFQPRPYPPPYLFCRRVGVHREQGQRPFAGDVGSVHTGVGAVESMVVKTPRPPGAMGG